MNERAVPSAVPMLHQNTVSLISHTARLNLLLDVLHTHFTAHPRAGRATHRRLTSRQRGWDKSAQRKAFYLSSSQLGPRDEHVRQQCSDTHAAELDRRHDGDASGGQVPPHDCRPPVQSHSRQRLSPTTAASLTFGNRDSPSHSRQRLWPRQSRNEGGHATVAIDNSDHGTLASRSTMTGALVVSTRALPSLSLWARCRAGRVTRRPLTTGAH